MPHLSRASSGLKGTQTSSPHLAETMQRHNWIWGMSTVHCQRNAGHLRPCPDQEGIHRWVTSTQPAPRDTR